MSAVSLWPASICLALSSGVVGDPQAEPPWLQRLREALPPFSIERVEPDEGASYANPSPDGTWLAYSYEYYEPQREAGGPWSIRLYDEDGKFLRDLTIDRFERATAFVWSQTSDAILVRPDIAWHGLRESDWLWKVDVHTGTMFPVTIRGLPKDELPIWSPTDMSYLVLEHKRLPNGSVKSTTIYRVWSDSGKRRRLAGSVWAGPAWSPDAKWITFGREAGPEYDRFDQLWTMASDGRRQRLLLSEETLEKQYKRDGWVDVDIGRPRWLGNTGRFLVPGARTDASMRSEYGMWVVDADSLRVQLLGFSALVLSVVGNSRDGRRLYLSVRDTDAEPPAPTVYYKLTLEPPEVE